MSEDVRVAPKRPPATPGGRSAGVRGSGAAAAASGVASGEKGLAAGRDIKVNVYAGAGPADPRSSPPIDPGIIKDLREHQQRLERFVAGYVGVKTVERRWPELRKATQSEDPDLDAIEYCHSEITKGLSGACRALSEEIQEAGELLDALKTSQRHMVQLRAHSPQDLALLDEIRVLAEEMLSKATGIESACGDGIRTELGDVKSLIEGLFRQLPRSGFEETVAKEAHEQAEPAKRTRPSGSPKDRPARQRREV